MMNGQEVSMAKIKICTRCFLVTGALFSTILFGCSTTVKQNVERPANLKVEDYSSVSALPFRTSAQMGAVSYNTEPIYTFEDYTKRQGEIYSSQTEENELLSYLDTNLALKFMANENLRYVNPQAVQYALSLRNTEIPVDVYITGGLTKFSSTVESAEETKKASDGTTIKETKYWRDVSATILYQVIEASTNRVLSNEEYSCSGSSSKVTDWRTVESSYKILSSKIDTFITRIMEDFTPHTETRKLTMLKSKDTGMKEAEKFAKNGQIVTARKMYLSIYRYNQLFEAGYNAALLYEAMDEYENALDLMTEVYRESGDSRAKEKITEIQNEIVAADRLRAQKKQ